MNDYKLPAWLVWFGVAAIAWGVVQHIDAERLGTYCAVTLPFVVDAVDARGGNVSPCLRRCADSYRPISERFLQAFSDVSATQNSCGEVMPVPNR